MNQYQHTCHLASFPVHEPISTHLSFGVFSCPWTNINTLVIWRLYLITNQHDHTCHLTSFSWSRTNMTTLIIWRLFLSTNKHQHTCHLTSFPVHEQTSTHWLFDVFSWPRTNINTLVIWRLFLTTNQHEHTCHLTSFPDQEQPSRHLSFDVLSWSRTNMTTLVIWRLYLSMNKHQHTCHLTSCPVHEQTSTHLSFDVFSCPRTNINTLVIWRLYLITNQHEHTCHLTPFPVHEQPSRHLSFDVFYCPWNVCLFSQRMEGGFYLNQNVQMLASHHCAWRGRDGGDGGGGASKFRGPFVMWWQPLMNASYLITDGRFRKSSGQVTQLWGRSVKLCIVSIKRPASSPSATLLIWGRVWREMTHWLRQRGHADTDLPSGRHPRWVNEWHKRTNAFLQWAFLGIDSLDIVPWGPVLRRMDLCIIISMYTMHFLSMSVSRLAGQALEVV